MSKAIEKISKVSGQDFLDAVQKRYLEKYADDVIRLMDDIKRLQKSLVKLEGWMTRVEDGDYVAIEEYKKRRAKLEVEEDQDF